MHQISMSDKRCPDLKEPERNRTNEDRKRRKGLTSPSQKPKIENTTQPTILRSLKIQILLNAENRRIAQCRLVDVEKCVADSKVG